MRDAFTDALLAAGPAAERGEKMDLYGWLIGSWDLDVTEFPPGAPPRRRSGEWHFAWVLEGRAIQDVWIVPRRGEERHGDPQAKQMRYGTTLRIYDPSLDAWHIQWSEPIHQVHWRMIGRREGPDIVQLGELPDGVRTRWSVREITDNSFLWRGELSSDGGKSWRTNIEFRARRTVTDKAAGRSTQTQTMHANAGQSPSTRRPLETVSEGDSPNSDR